jgi:hypothetical protein
LNLRPLGYETYDARRRRLPRPGTSLLALSTYLGHVEPADTYWYLTATAALLAQAARRLENAPQASR